MPNAVQVVIGTALDQSGVDPEHGQPVVVLEANVDDVTGEILGATLAALMRAGALDAWVTPVTGKKGRPAHVVSVLCDPASVGRLRQVLADETGTLGIRAQSWQRWPAERQFAEVEVGGYPVRVKRGPRRIKAEHDDAARVAGLLRMPIREVARRAEEAAHRLFDGATATAADRAAATRRAPPAEADGGHGRPVHRPASGRQLRAQDYGRLETGPYPVRPGGRSAIMERCSKPAS